MVTYARDTFTGALFALQYMLTKLRIFAIGDVQQAIDVDKDA